MAENFHDNEDRCRFELDGSIAFVSIANPPTRSPLSILRCRRNWAGEESARSSGAQPLTLCGRKGGNSPALRVDCGR